MFSIHINWNINVTLYNDDILELCIKIIDTMINTLTLEKTLTKSVRLDSYSYNCLSIFHTNDNI